MNARACLEYAGMNEELDRQIEAVLDKIRPFMKREGGDITYIGEKDGTVYVEMGGACQGCMYADADISAGVEIIVMEEVPGIVRVVNDPNPPSAVLDQYRARKEKAEREKAKS